jgi:hypothetical protein
MYLIVEVLFMKGFRFASHTKRIAGMHRNATQPVG